MIDDKLKFQRNKSAVEKQGLNVSGDLVRLEVLVD